MKVTHSFKEITKICIVTLNNGAIYGSLAKYGSLIYRRYESIAYWY